MVSGEEEEVRTGMKSEQQRQGERGKGERGAGRTRSRNPQRRISKEDKARMGNDLEGQGRRGQRAERKRKPV